MKYLGTVAQSSSHIKLTLTPTQPPFVTSYCVKIWWRHVWVAQWIGGCPGPEEAARSEGSWAFISRTVYSDVGTEGGTSKDQEQVKPWLPLHLKGQGEQSVDIVVVGGFSFLLFQSSGGFYWKQLSCAKGMLSFFPSLAGATAGGPSITASW